MRRNPYWLIAIIAAAGCFGDHDIEQTLDGANEAGVNHDLCPPGAAREGAVDLAENDDLKLDGEYYPDLGATCNCAYLVGNCQTPGESCLCWEKGTMVCQQNHQWELILDVSHCPDQEDPTGYAGLGCIGAADSCGDCTCDRQSERYECPVDLGHTDL